ncbi:hypothetical protein ACA910_007398 [Epithemia clementina (nom. ined.)]
MIDRELFRPQHKKDFESAWMKQHKQALLLLKEVPNIMLDDDELESMRQYKRDQLLASQHPEQYCADRCISTGHCSVYEHVFDFTPEQVLQFCHDCVLSDGEEPCDLPPSFFEDLMTTATATTTTMTISVPDSSSLY